MDDPPFGAKRTNVFLAGSLLEQGKIEAVKNPVALGWRRQLDS